MSGPRTSKKSDPRGDDDSKCFERIRELVEKTTKMQLAADSHHRKTEEYFQQLRHRLDSSSAFLRSAKHDIDNIKFLFQRDHIDKMNSPDYLDSVDKTDEEIEEEIKCVQEKLTNLQNRLQTLNGQAKSESSTFEEAVTRTISTLSEVSEGTFRNE